MLLAKYTILQLELVLQVTAHNPNITAPLLSFYVSSCPLYISNFYFSLNMVSFLFLFFVLPFLILLSFFLFHFYSACFHSLYSFYPSFSSFQINRLCAKLLQTLFPPLPKSYSRNLKSTDGALHKYQYNHVKWHAYPLIKPLESFHIFTKEIFKANTILQQKFDKLCFPFLY